MDCCASYIPTFDPANLKWFYVVIPSCDITRSCSHLQRICVARALGPNTRFLIADEMTTMLDAITQAHIWHAVMEIDKRRGMGIIVVSHESKLMQRLCQRVIDFNDFID